jgi:uncharacterized protein YtpQ (UPF0354 family)
MKQLIGILLAAVASVSHGCPLPSHVNESRVVPVIRGNSNIAASFPAAPNTVPVFVLNEEISVVFAEDTLSSINYFLVPREEAPCWSDGAQLKKYIPNIERMSSRPRAGEVSPGLFMMLAGGNYESSFILEPEFLARAAGSKEKSVIVGVPTRDVLLFAAPENEAALSELRARVDYVYERADKVVSKKLMRIEPGRILVLGQ